MSIKDTLDAKVDFLLIIFAISAETYYGLLFY